MPSELHSLSELFQNRLFRIPDYQRGYAWKFEQLADFWDDLENLQLDRYHYTGLLSLKAVSRVALESWKDDKWLLDNGYKAYHVIDGQQRLTTFSILLYELVSYVRKLPENQGLSDAEIYFGVETLKEIEAKYILRKRPPKNLWETYLLAYETDASGTDYLKHRIFGAPYGGTILETYYTKNLADAKSFFSEKLRELYKSEGLQGLERLYQKLTLKLKFNLHEIEDDYDVFVAFETMNNRGKKLTNLELLKNRLIYLTTLFDYKELDRIDKGKLRQNINEAWKEAYHHLGRNRTSLLSDDEFLRAHWTVYFQYSRRRGDDYIQFLLEKFSSKNIFEKRTLVAEVQSTEASETEDDADGFESTGETTETGLSSQSSANPIVDPDGTAANRLKPQEISDYINSLKEFSEHWYETFFPADSASLSPEEKAWIDRLNRVGIGYFRPLVAVALATRPSSPPTDIRADRIRLFQAIERFIFLTFRVGGLQASYKSSEYLNRARDIYRKNLSLESVITDLNDTIARDMADIVNGFILRTDRRFDSDDGFYSWRDLRYFLFEYEDQLARKFKLDKVSWALFSRIEKDKVTIEHILPQKPDAWYWRNQFRQFDEQEIKTLSSSLGNLLPLAHSINASLQNDPFPDKKRTKPNSRRGYENGSHAEIEVSHNADWDAVQILERGLHLLHFMERRWQFTLNDDQKMRLLHLEFVNDGRPELPELPEEQSKKIITRADPTLIQSGAVVGQSSASIDQTGTESKHMQVPESKPDAESLSPLEEHNFDFWTKFAAYCKAVGRVDNLGSFTPSTDDWHDFSIDNPSYYLFLQVIKKGQIRIGIYVRSPEDFARLESRKEALEAAYGHSLEWYTSRPNSVAKRILHVEESDVYDENLYPQHFAWYVTQFDLMRKALQKVDGG